MSGRAFIDTNVVLYLLSADAAKADRAEAVVAAGGVVSVQVLNEFTAVAARKLKMPMSEIREVLAAVRASCAVVPLTIETHQLGLDVRERYGFSVYDSLIVAAAILADAARLMTEDLADGMKIGALVIENPFRGL